MNPWAAWWSQPSNLERVHNITEIVGWACAIAVAIALPVAWWTGNALREHLETELQQMQTRLQPRSLSPQARATLTAKLVGFRDTRAAIGALPLTSEGIALGRQILEVLTAAGWAADWGQEMAEGPLGGIARGVWVLTTSDPRSIAAASELVKGLQEEGVRAGHQVGLPFADSSTARPEDPTTFMILVIVGDRP